jgi:glucokinase
MSGLRLLADSGGTDARCEGKGRLRASLARIPAWLVIGPCPALNTKTITKENPWQLPPTRPCP